MNLARLMDMRPSQIRAALIDLDEWGLIQACGSNAWSITYRGTQSIRTYLPGKMPIA